MTPPTVTQRESLAREASRFFAESRAHRVRSIREFAEQEIVIPDGPHEGRRFRLDRQPYCRHVFDAIDSGQWDRFNACGPTQSGKTLTCCIIPLLWHLFELTDTAIFGLPDLAMSADKWRENIKPAICRTRFERWLPRRGPGSRGGTVKESVEFENGPTLRFMSGGGGDKQRAGFTSRVLVVSETDGMDEAGIKSRESSKIQQLMGRTRAFSRSTGRPARQYFECTVSTEQGWTWRQHKAGSTGTRILLPCPRCDKWVTPEREHLQGWQEAESETEAGEKAAFHCPDCGQPWTEAERADVNAASRVIHAGQTLAPDGTIEGELPPTRTHSLRWTAVNNLLVTAGDIGVDEWNAARSEKPEEAEREMCQFVWTLPPKQTERMLAPLDMAGIMRRQGALARGLLPADTSHVTVGVDIGKWRLHYVVIAWTSRGLYVPDYDMLDVPSQNQPVSRAIMGTLRQLRDHIASGWTVDTPSGGPVTRTADQVWIDSGWKDSRDAVHDFCKESTEQEGLPAQRARYRPTIGIGLQHQRRAYVRPRGTGHTVVDIREGHHFVRHKQTGLFVVEIDANYFKSFIHDRLSIPREQPGALQLFRAARNEHRRFSRHMTAERQIESYIPGRGTVTVWKTESANNHWLDSICLAAAAGKFLGCDGLPADEDKPPPPPATPTTPAADSRPIRNRPGRLRMPDGRPWSILDR